MCKVYKCILNKLIFALQIWFVITSSHTKVENVSSSHVQHFPDVLSHGVSTTEYVSKLNNQTHCKCWIAEFNPIFLHECTCIGPKYPEICCIKLASISISKCSERFLSMRDIGQGRIYLRDIIFSDFPQLIAIQDDFLLSEFPNIRTFDISQAPNLQSISASMFKNVSSSFKTLRITYSGLRNIPDLSFIGHVLHVVDFEGNQITYLNERSVKVRTEQLVLDNNLISYIEADAFEGSQIAKLSLKNNKRLKALHEHAFSQCISINELDLSNTLIEKLPTDGLQELEILIIQNTHSLKQIPSLYFFKNLRFAYLTHSFHCCAFKYPKRHDKFLYEKKLKWIEKLQENCIKDWQDNKRSKRNLQLEDVDEDDDEMGEFTDDAVTLLPNNMLVDARCGNITLETYYDKTKIKCYPEPDALNPCEDVMGSSWLRCSVWLVVCMALFGNFAVLLVLLAFLSELTVPKLLICNLAFADLCMGVYLFLLASIDYVSKGEFFNFAFDWQYGPGCKAAGFLTIFASHLSVFTLTVITLERYFAIRHAIYLNRRIKLNTARYVMFLGWIYAVSMASLPLIGVSNYSSTSICLPMEARDNYDIVFLFVVLALNGFAFCVILFCYARIYFSLAKETRRGGQGSKGEMTIAKKMALLVFTNFICWSPIAFFGITALFGHPLIDVTKSKIILVFFYPINSCANPYLYAILTSQYRRDLFMLLEKFGLFKQRARKYKLTYTLPTHEVQMNMIEPTSVRRTTLESSIKKDDSFFSSKEKVAQRVDIELLTNNKKYEEDLI